MNKLKLYNTLSKQKENFIPQDKDRVTLYVCGPTVYNRIHIGNARPAVIFDMLFRLLKDQYSQVVYARNITDIDDKIMALAVENNESIESVSVRYTQAYQEDMAALNNLPPTLTPYATEHLPEMIAMVQNLIDKGNAYAVESEAEGKGEGHVLFDVRSMENYGELSKRSLDDMLAGARVEVADYKKYAGDFVLWKPSSDAEPGWDSPWGRGRPGWHLECSAMIEKHLGDTIDIHGGGRDLIFPHHENEIAQSTCTHGGKQFVRYWMHNGYINIGGEKMSKSLGNFRMVNELLKEYPGEVLRFALLSAHYRSELNFDVKALDQARHALDSLYGFLRQAQDIPVDKTIDITESNFYKALLDDLNTPIAISALHGLAKFMNKTESKEEKLRLKSLLLKSGSLLGLLQQDPEQWFQGGESESDVNSLSTGEIETLIAKREQAKQDKDYALSDKIRDDLKAQGVVLEDSRNGTSWKR